MEQDDGVASGDPDGAQLRATAKKEEAIVKNGFYLDNERYMVLCRFQKLRREMLWREQLGHMELARRLGVRMEREAARLADLMAAAHGYHVHRCPACHAEVEEKGFCPACSEQESRAAPAFACGHAAGAENTILGMRHRAGLQPATFPLCKTCHGATVHPDLILED